MCGWWKCPTPIGESWSGASGTKGLFDLRGKWPSADGDPAVAPGAGEPYSAALVVQVAEAVGGARGGLHRPVGRLGAGVGDAGLQEAEHLGPPGLDRAGEALEFGQSGVGAPGVEPVQPGRDLVA